MPIVTLGGERGPDPEQGLFATPTVESLVVAAAECAPWTCAVATGETVLADGMQRPLVVRARANDRTRLPVVGILVAMPKLTRSTLVQLGTVLWPTPSLIPGATYCVGPNGELLTQRDLVALRATFPGLFVQAIGTAIAKDRLQVSPSSPPFTRLP